MTRAALILCLIGSQAAALELSLPNATVALSEAETARSVRLPDKPWSPGAVPATAEGIVHREVLRIPRRSLTTLQLLADLRETLEAEGYEEVFTCADTECGSFDFRFQLDIIGEPDMYVDLGDFRYVLARSTDPEARPHTVALLASRSQTTGFVHITTVSSAPPEPAPEPAAPEAAETPAPAPVPDDLIAMLTDAGHAALEDLQFATGSSELAEAPYTSLATLAEWLLRTPSARIVLVGHTDAVGSLDANTALSRRRAAAVSDRLAIRYGIDPAQLQAAGAGYLAPRASNLTEEGRALNRRVEVVLLAAE